MEKEDKSESNLIDRLIDTGKLDPLGIICQNLSGDSYSLVTFFLYFTIQILIYFTSPKQNKVGETFVSIEIFSKVTKNGFLKKMN